MSWGRRNYEMTLRDVEEGGLRFYEMKGRMNGEQAEPTEVDDLPLLDTPPDCRICADEVTWCPECDPDYYRDSALDR